MKNQWTLFYVLRRLVLLGFGLAVAGALYAVYVHRSMFQPVADYATRYYASRKVDRVYQGQLDGTVTRAVYGDQVQVRGADGYLYTFQCAGLKGPRLDGRRTDAYRQLYREAKTFLADLVVSNRVRVDYSLLTETRSGYGVLWLGETNVNTVILEHGFAALDSNSLKYLPLPVQVTLVRAQRRGQRAGRGGWGLVADTNASPWAAQYSPEGTLHR